MSAIDPDRYNDFGKTSYINYSYITETFCVGSVGQYMIIVLVASVPDMHACRCKFNRLDCWLGANGKYMTNGRMQVLQTWLMIGYKCIVHRC